MDEHEENKKQNEEGDELSKYKKERDEYLDGWKRAKADLINYKKDEAKRFEEIIRFSNEAIISELIKVLDSFDLALTALKLDEQMEKGIYLIRSQLEDTMRKNGLEKIISLVGQPFDPSLQEAVMTVESDKPSGTVLEEVERGYLLNGRVVRPARVKVVK